MLSTDKPEVNVGVKLRTGPRPIGVWVISVFYLLSAAWTLLSYVLLSFDDAQRRYVESLTGFDWLLAISFTLLVTAAAVSLLLLRRVAVVLFGMVLALSLTKAISATPGAMAGIIFGWVLLGVTLVYVRNLAKKGILS